MIFFCDAHLHISQCSLKEIFFHRYCSCAHSPKEFEIQSQIMNNAQGSLSCYGVPPDNPQENSVYYLEELLSADKINAVGETGFDFFTRQLKEDMTRQIFVFESQLELALQFNKPIVIHCRKGYEKLFEYKAELSRLPAVMFHNFPGNEIQARALLSNGINCFFSLGKQLLNNNKKALDCMSNLDISTILLETDAPFGCLKNETETFPREIEKVYMAAYHLRQKDFKDFEDFKQKIEKNFNSFAGCS